MDSRAGRADDTPAGEGIHPDERTEDALEFVRFCRRRKRVGWPELYDEMCLVAARRAFRDWGLGELADHGIAFTLFDMPRLAALVAQECREERERVHEREVAVGRGAAAAGAVAGASIG